MPLSPAINFVTERIGAIHITLYSQDNQPLCTIRSTSVDNAISWLKDMARKHGHASDSTAGDVL